ncbi:MAG: DUF4192 domain-containing protein [Nostocoides sp.]
MDTITVGSTVDFAITIPYQLGYHPGGSLVVVGFDGKRVLGIMRIDLGEPDRPDFGVEALNALVREGADGVIVVAFEDRPSQGAPLLRSFVAGAVEHKIAVRDVLVIRGRRWFAVGATGHAHGNGRPLPDPSRVPAVAEFVARGRSPLPSRDALRDLVECDGSVLSVDIGSEVSALLAAAETPEPLVSPESVAAWRLLLADDRPATDAAPVVSRALVGLLDRDWRDGLLAWLCPDTLSLDLVRVDVRTALRASPRPALPVGEDAADSAPGAPTGAASADAVADDGDEDRLQRRLVGLCRLVPDGAGDVAAAILTVAAHVAWCDGDGTIAAVALARALRVAPHYRLAQLLDQLVGAGIRASTARSERSTGAPDRGRPAA